MAAEVAASCRTGTAGATGGFPRLWAPPPGRCSSGRRRRAATDPPAPGSPCIEGSRCCWRWIGHGGAGARRAAAPGSVGAAGGGRGPAGWGCCHSGSPRSSGAGGGRRVAARGGCSRRGASCGGTRPPTAVGQAAP